MVKVLFVCTGNICRSPTAEGVLRKAVQEAGLSHLIDIDSAGTHNYHVGEAPDHRSIAHAKKRNVDIASLKARNVRVQDFHDFDLILALDAGHLRHLQAMAPKNSRATVALFLEYAGHPTALEVPDPYYSGAAQFEYVLDLVEAAAIPLIDKIKQGA